MERRKFLVSLCGLGAAAVALSPGAARAVDPRRRCRIVNGTEKTIYLKIAGPIPGMDSRPERGGVLFPEEEYFDNLGVGKRVVIAWDFAGEKLLTMKEVEVATPCHIVVREGDVFVSHGM
jgi:hypothetical protein